MKLILDILEQRISDAMVKASGQGGCAAIVKPAVDAKFGDYQANGVMALAKQLKTNPRQLAEKIVSNLDVSDICEQPQIAGPGFINLRLKPEFIANALLEIKKDTENLAVEKTNKAERIVVDFSGPNIAKQMHVGHLRSTIIGDCICRMLKFMGHEVIPQNHIGDWGTQFGMLVQHLLETRIGAAFGETQASVSDMEEFYREAKKRYDTDEKFAAASRDCVVKLHNHEPQILSLWRNIVNLSLQEIYPKYELLNVNLSPEDVRGESFYNPKLSEVVNELKQKGLAKESQGAVCVFPEGFKNKDGEPLPLIVQKSDGAFLYATTDLAAIRYRVNELKADRIIYVTDLRQGLHFEMVFKVAKMAGWTDDKVKLQHITFGSVLGEDGKPLKTRSGENVKLKELLDEAVTRARKVVDEKNPELSESQRDNIANAVGIGAVKYADYSNNRTSDYIFSFDKMLAMEGNTAPYMQYAYARVRSIERKAAKSELDIQAELAGIETLNLTEPTEFDLARHLIRYGEAIYSAAADFRPNFITGYLYELAQKFSAFYTECPVLKADKDKRPTRLLLCDLTARTIQHGLQYVLGIETPEQM
ncbi:MAG: arginine--tRNA ligase [Phycisphaerae bacterium]|nr:arginine--tRNA ligase [Phycisphaerae bacterium]